MSKENISTKVDLKLAPKEWRNQGCFNTILSELRGWISQFSSNERVAIKIMTKLVFQLGQVRSVRIKTPLWLSLIELTCSTVIENWLIWPASSVAVFSFMFKTVKRCGPKLRCKAVTYLKNINNFLIILFWNSIKKIKVQANGVNFTQTSSFASRKLSTLRSLKKVEQWNCYTTV